MKAIFRSPVIFPELPVQIEKITTNSKYWLTQLANKPKELHKIQILI